MVQTCLMLGAGMAPPVRRIISPSSAPEDQTKWKTLDINPESKPHALFNLENLEKGEQLPFPVESFDEIHAYEVLEHFGRQGDYRGFFATFRALWSRLVKRGLLMGTCPSITSNWLWADPGHTRVITPDTLSFLTKAHYEQLGQTACTDYRAFVDPCWWEIEHSETDGGTFAFALRKIR